MPRTPIAASCPRPGRLVRYRAASAGGTKDGRMRVDDGVAEGGEVSIFYDPMIAKLITSGADPRGGDRPADRRARRLPDRRDRPQCRFPLRADAASALPRGRAHHRLHRRGISGRLSRRAGRRRADRQTRRDRRGIAVQPGGARARRSPDQLGDPIAAPCDWTRAHRRRRASGRASSRGRADGRRRRPRRGDRPTGGPATRIASAAIDGARPHRRRSHRARRLAAHDARRLAHARDV